MNNHWTKSTFGKFILMQEIKFLRQALVLSPVQNITVVLDADSIESGLLDTCSALFKEIKDNYDKNIFIQYVVIDHSIPTFDQPNPKVEQASSAYCHLVDAQTGTHIDNDSADWIILFHAIESCKKPRQLLREATRVLDQGGRMSVVAFNPVRYFERALWRKLTKTRPSVKTELSSYRLSDWLQVLNYEITRSTSFISPLLALFSSYREKQIEKNNITTFPWLGSVYSIEAIKQDIPMTPISLKNFKKKRMSLRLVSTSQRRTGRPQPIPIKKSTSNDKPLKG